MSAMPPKQVKTMNADPSHQINEAAAAYAMAVAGYESIREKHAALVAREEEIFRKKKEAIDTAWYESLTDSSGLVCEAKAELLTLLEAHPELFVKPRSRVVAGVEFGYEQGKPVLVRPEDDEVLVQNIQDNLPPKQQQVCLKVTTKPVLNAIKNLGVTMLAKIGCAMMPGEDKPFVKEPKQKRQS